MCTYVHGCYCVTEYIIYLRLHLHKWCKLQSSVLWIAENITMPPATLIKLDRLMIKVYRTSLNSVWFGRLTNHKKSPKTYVGLWSFVTTGYITVQLMHLEAINDSVLLTWVCRQYTRHAPPPMHAQGGNNTRFGHCGHISIVTSVTLCICSSSTKIASSYTHWDAKYNTKNAYGSRFVVPHWSLVHAHFRQIFMLFHCPSTSKVTLKKMGKCISWNYRKHQCNHNQCIGVIFHGIHCIVPDSKVHVANVGSTWVLSAPGGPHVGPMNIAIWDVVYLLFCSYSLCIYSAPIHTLAH